MTKADWDALKYPVMLQQDLPTGIWVAWIPMLGYRTTLMDGASPAEALESVERWRREQYQVVVDSEIRIPVPPGINEAHFATPKWVQFQRDGTISCGVYTTEEVQRNPDLVHPFSQG